MSDLEIYRGGGHSQSSNHTPDPGQIEEVKQENEEESKMSLEIDENINMGTESPKKTRNVSRKDSVICINKKEALGLC